MELTHYKKLLTAVQSNSSPAATVSRDVSPVNWGPWKTRAGPGRSSSGEVLVTVARRYASAARAGTARWSSAASRPNLPMLVLWGPPSAGTASGR